MRRARRPDAATAGTAAPQETGPSPHRAPSGIPKKGAFRPGAAASRQRSAAGEDRLAEQARHDGNPEAAQDHQNRAQDNNRAAGNAYDSAERRDADAAEWAKSGDAAAVQARRTADLSNARPATEATRPRRTPKNRTTSRRPTRTRSRNAGVSR